MANSPETLRAYAEVDLDALAHNVREVLTRTDADLMAVVKADAYGHGAVGIARTVLAAGARMLGVATLDEAVTLRLAGIDAQLVCWLWTPQEDLRYAVDTGVELVVYSLAHLARVLEFPVPDSRVPGRAPRIHLKADTGLGRGGATPADWQELCRAAAAAERDGLITVVGLMSHLASADEEDDPSVGEQTDSFREMAAAAEAAGLTPEYRHLANSPGTLDHPSTHFDLVRCGIALYGLDPLRADATPGGRPVDPGLRPVMTLRSRVVLTKRVPAGHGVSYGLTYRTPAETTLALIPLGYADGIPRSASSRGEVQVNGRRYRIAGRVAMDQFVIDVGDDPVEIGDQVVVFGPGDHGEPTVADWATYAGTIHYEIVTRLGPRVSRVYIGGPS